jgi:hypothetical protein
MSASVKVHEPFHCVRGDAHPRPDEVKYVLGGSVKGPLNVEGGKEKWRVQFIIFLKGIDHFEKGRVRASVSKVGILRIVKGKVFGPVFDNFPNYKG